MAVLTRYKKIRYAEFCFKCKHGGKMSKEQVIAWWETQSYPERWRVDVLQENGNGEFAVVLKSGSPEFPVKVEEFGPFEEDTLIYSLKTTFPGAEIMLKF